ncbi:Glyoxalase/Bleomycin resistance protein/Dioxygenase superfamily protein [Hydrobacter penzbergensis]|uniref:Glyoxalase/Bleomycin resistance protein/Dioxygenase superfamily protein n=1 Tax=Hydrobacter penzbergensis TaxID=1235997 RepID=A0A8X8LAK4_9BACT|nr:VOC family protein [Hydrobacter penzbergensis]SDW45905.1 Glyoxalase/Bleomycin resistance protein/Dioxygenase superfamily protein [Hydrobacter penzbergensis]
MRIRIQEIEFGVNEPSESEEFYKSVLGFELSVSQNELKVLKPGVNELDLNFSLHVPQGTVFISFLCDDLEEIMSRLINKNIPFDGPKKSHLGMKTISFRDPSGYLVKINIPTDESPQWLRATFQK